MEVVEKPEPERAWRTNMKPKPAQPSNPPSHNNRDDSHLHINNNVSHCAYVFNFVGVWVSSLC